MIQAAAEDFADVAGERGVHVRGVVAGVGAAHGEQADLAAKIQRDQRGGTFGVFITGKQKRHFLAPQRGAEDAFAPQQIPQNRLQFVFAGEDDVARFALGAEQQQTDAVELEILQQAALQGGFTINQGIGFQQGQAQLADLVEQAVVVAGHVHQFVEFVAQFSVAGAQHAGLLFQQRGCIAVAVGQLQVEQQVGAVNEKIRMGTQESDDVGGGEFVLLGFAHGDVGHSVMVPSYTVVAGPVISTGWPSPCHSICKVPPGSVTFTLLLTRPAAMLATAAAQAPVPQARVSPTPRSNTRRRRLSRSTTWQKPMLALLGKWGCASSRGPMVATGAVSTSSTCSTPWGLPIDTQAICTVSPSAVNWYSGCCCCAIRGIRSGSKIGAPMFTVTSPPLTSCSSMRPVLVSTGITFLLVRFLS